MSKESSHNEKKSEGTPGRASASEYRLIPVDQWPDANSSVASDSSTINVRELLDTTWQRRNIILKVTAVFIAIGVLVALLSPVEYQTGATLLPEDQAGSSGAGGLIEQYGGMLGIGNNLQIGRQESIPPDLYPDIVHSLPYQLEILNKKVYYSRYDTTVSNYVFFDDIYSPSVFSYLKSYTLGLPNHIKNLFREEGIEPPLPKGFQGDSIVTITKHQASIVGKMRGRITVVLDDETNLINLSVEMPDPNAAAEIGQLSVTLLKEYITNYRTRKAQEDLEFSQQQLAQAEDEFQGAQVRLADFQDQNIGQLTARARTQEQRLQSEYDLTFNKYNALAQQVEQAKLRVQEKTPVVTVLQPIQMPVDNAKPQRRMIVLGFLVIGLMLSVGYVIVSKLRENSSQESQRYS